MSKWELAEKIAESLKDYFLDQRYITKDREIMPEVIETIHDIVSSYTMENDIK